MSRVVIGGATLAAAVAAGSAYTNTTDGLAGSVAGYGSETVSGATVTNIAYNPDAELDHLVSVVFTANGDLTDTASTMVLRHTGNTVDTGATSDCVPVFVGPHTDITCTMDTPPLISSFDGLALSVVSA